MPRDVIGDVGLGVSTIIRAAGAGSAARADRGESGLHRQPVFRHLYVAHRFPAVPDPRRPAAGRDAVPRRALCRRGNPRGTGGPSLVARPVPDRRAGRGGTGRVPRAPASAGPIPPRHDAAPRGRWSIPSSISSLGSRSTSPRRRLRSCSSCIPWGWRSSPSCCLPASRASGRAARPADPSWHSGSIGSRSACAPW